MKLEMLDGETATIESAFLSPEEACITMHKTWMKESVRSGIPNNFQQVQKAGERYNVMWGHEQFIITSQVDRESGIIRRATMDNTLTLKRKANYFMTSLQTLAHKPIFVHASTSKF